MTHLQVNWCLTTHPYPCLCYIVSYHVDAIPFHCTLNWWRRRNAFIWKPASFQYTSLCHWGLVTHMRLALCSTPNHCLKQCWIYNSRTLRNNFQLDLNKKKTSLFFQENSAAKKRRSFCLGLNMLYNAWARIPGAQLVERCYGIAAFHDDDIKWKYFPHYWPFVRGIHRSPVNSPHKGQWRGALMFSLTCAWINGCKQSGSWWLETPSRSLWRHCNALSATGFGTQTWYDFMCLNGYNIARFLHISGISLHIYRTFIFFQMRKKGGSSFHPSLYNL